MRCAAAAILAAHGAAGADRQADEHQGAHRSARAELDAAFRERLAALQSKCAELQLDEPARLTGRWYIPRDPHRQYLYLPAETDPHRPAGDAPKLVQQWYARFSALRRAHAAALFQLAHRELAADRPTEAYQLLHEVLREDPDQPRARAALGYRRAGDRWHRPEGMVTARLQRLPSPALGLNAGEYWIVESGNFHVTSALGQAPGRELAAQLEQLYAVWQQLFFPFWNNAAALGRRLDGPGGAAARPARRHKVVLFRDREQYLHALQKAEPRIELTIGYYRESTRTACFYGGDDVKRDTRFHEVTHQLFSESDGTVPAVGGAANAWIIEGVALYLESLQAHEGYCTVGGLDADRLQYARYRTRNEGAYTPLEQLVALGRSALQEHEEIRRLYSQSAGLTAFLMDYEQGRYRRALVEYLQKVYRGRGDARTLAAVTAVPLPELDKQYGEFLDVTDANLACLAAIPSARRLSLGRTSVTDAGLRHLAGHTQLEWVDLAYTKTGDAGLASLQAAKGLKHLIAEHTALTDAALPTIGRFEQLEILDLSGTNISDAGLAALSQLTRLTELWLGGTPISDAGLRHLHSLKRLKMLDVNGTRVTPEGFRQLKQALPALETEAR